MTQYLLDVNVLISMLDPEHEHHLRARQWFESDGHKNWLTCPTTENGVIRIMSGPAYSKFGASPARVIVSLHSLVAVGNHHFVPDNISMMDEGLILRSRLLATKLVTDSYLLAIAVTNGAVLATLDRRLVPDAVRSGADHLMRIP